MNRRTFSRLHYAASLLLGYVLAAGAQQTPQTPAASQANAPGAGYVAMQPPTRAIIYFQRTAAEDPKLSAAISEACRCQSVFFRPYLGNALIYEIALPMGQTFNAFAAALMRNAETLGIKSVEQDSIMRHQ